MKMSSGVKPISYFKAHASEVIRDVVENQRDMVITQNGEAKVILQDLRVYEQMQESLALLKILSLSTASLGKGKFRRAEEAFEELGRKVGKGQTG
jgi:prevent-host-death family protein